MQSIEFSRSDEEHCLNSKDTFDGSTIYPLLYIDNMLLIWQNVSELVDLWWELNLNLAMKDLGLAQHILRMKITQHKTIQELYLSQADYIRHTMESFNMQDFPTSSLKGDHMKSAP